MGIGGNVSPYGQVRASVVESNVYDNRVMAIRYVEIPSNLQHRLDYGTRADGQPDYAGFAERGVGISASAWLIHKFTYDADPGKMTLRQIAYGVWDDRASESYA